MFNDVVSIGCLHRATIIPRPPRPVWICEVTPQTHCSVDPALCPPPWLSLTSALCPNGPPSFSPRRTHSDCSMRIQGGTVNWAPLLCQTKLPLLFFSSKGGFHTCVELRSAPVFVTARVFATVSKNETRTLYCLEKMHCCCWELLVFSGSARRTITHHQCLGLGFCNCRVIIVISTGIIIVSMDCEGIHGIHWRIS